MHSKSPIRAVPVKYTVKKIEISAKQSFITLTIKIMSKFTAKKALQFRSLTVFKNLAQNFVHDVEMAPEGLLDDVNGRVQDHKFKGHRLHSTLVHQGRQGDLKQKH